MATPGKRVPIDSITQKSAYQYFAGWGGGNPAWAKELSERKPVFDLPGECYRPCIVYNPGIRR